MIVPDTDEVLILATGDVAPSRPDPDTLFAGVTERLNRADIAFCQLEINMTTRGSRLPQVRHTDRTSPDAAHALRRAGFDVVSWAGNHCMDWGQEGFFDTIAALRGAELAVIGAGADIHEARRPVILERRDQRIAFLAYSSILPMNFHAEEDRPGCAPMRAWTLYEQIEHDQPGTPCRIHTFPHREDLAALCRDVAAARANADVVLVSLHWGIHFVPAVIADYQRDVGRAAIDAGADVILGHHAHILKGVEFHRGRPIIYSLCNFAVDLPMTPEHAQSRGFLEIRKLHPHWEPDFDSSYNFPADSRRTVVASVRVRAGRVERVSLLPAWVNRQSQPEILAAADPRFAEVAGYLEEVTRAAGLNAEYVRSGDELILQERSS
ncbi:MAG: CapA family protein [Gammaproteobacteria bacterium]|nr:MAG: CapA family protein [Gammaproteobacteria bacterium]